MLLPFLSAVNSLLFGGCSSFSFCFYSPSIFLSRSSIFFLFFLLPLPSLPPVLPSPTTLHSPSSSSHPSICSCSFLSLFLLLLLGPLVPHDPASHNLKDIICPVLLYGFPYFSKCTTVSSRVWLVGYKKLRMLTWVLRDCGNAFWLSVDVCGLFICGSQTLGARNTHILKSFC